MKMIDLLGLLKDVEDQENFRPPEGDDPRLKAAFARHMETQAWRAEQAWRLVFTCDDFPALADAAADLLLRASVHAESACKESAATWKAQADYWDMVSAEKYPARHSVDPPSPHPRG